MQELAINGGEKVRVKSFPSRRDIGDEELKELADIICHGISIELDGVKLIYSRS
ncbi:MAG: hypothetical protein ACUVTL_09700 [Thermoproteota archaeon]